MLAVFAVAAVTILLLMAQRYGKLLDRPDAPRPPAAEEAGPVTPPATGVAHGAGAARDAQTVGERALRYVDAFIAVRRALAAAADSPAGAAPPDDERGALDRALADAGLDRVTYDAMLEIYEAWKAGRTDLSGPLPDAFERRRAELEESE